jgi:4-hydroxy-3-polyprenylbenzoate decarboxylase
MCSRFGPLRGSLLAFVNNGRPSSNLNPSLASFYSTSTTPSPSPPATDATPKKRIIVGMTGATGAILGIELLRVLRRMNVETHLVVSKWADMTIKYETDWDPMDVRALASHVYAIRDLAAPMASGSFHVDGMIIVPCSMKTLAATRMGYSEDLISRAADVTLKERRKLVLVTRETPLSDIHLENMLSLTRSGAVIFPPMPAFYTKPNSVDDIVQQSVGRMLDIFDIDTGNFERWSGMKKSK